MNPAPSPGAQPPARRRAGVVLLLLALILATVLVSVARRGPRDRIDAGLGDALEAERLARVVLATEDAPGAKEWAPVETAYREALRRNPRLSRARRGLAAVLYLRGDRAGARRAVSFPADVPPAGEGAWNATRVAYGAEDRPKTRGQLAAFRSALRDPALGWSRYPAMEALADSPEAAKAVRSEMRRRYLGSTMLLLALGLAGAAAMVIGSVLLVRVWRDPPPDRLPEPNAPPAALGLTFVGAMLALLMGSLLMQLLVSGGKVSAGMAGPYPFVLGSLGGCAVSLATVALYLRPFGGLASLGWGVSGTVRFGLGGYLAMVPALLAATILAGLGQRLAPGVDTPLNPAVPMVLTARGPMLALVWLTVCVAAPLVEEVLMRGLLFRSLISRLGTQGAALTSAAVFAGLHPQLPLGFLPILVIGYGLCLVYRASGSLTPCVVLHAVNNTVALLAATSMAGHLA